MTTRRLDEIRRKRPKLAKKADYGTSYKGAISLFCEHCVDTRAEVVKCTDFACPLHPHRPGAARGPKRPPGYVFAEVAIGRASPVDGVAHWHWCDATRSLWSAPVRDPSRVVRAALAFLRAELDRRITELQAARERLGGE